MADPRQVAGDRTPGQASGLQRAQREDVVVPVARPAPVTVFVLQLVVSWNETLPVALFARVGRRGTEGMTLGVGK